MDEVMPLIDCWLAAGETVALATVVATWGSAPRPAGSVMAINGRGGIAGSVSGGCIEGSVVTEALRTIADGRARRLRYGVGDENAWEVGLSCGGTIEVLITPFDRQDPVTSAWRENLAAGRAFAIATRLDGELAGRRMLIAEGSPPVGGLGKPALDAATVVLLQQALQGAVESGPQALLDDGQEREIFLAVHAPPPRLVLVGAVHVAVPLVGFARAVGFRVTVVDPRTAFASRERFPEVDRLIHDWPEDALTALGLDRRTYVATLSHDPKLDLPALRLALRSPAAYIGALGSKRTHQRRLATLRDEGFTAADLGRIHAPIGLDLGGRRAEEVALAIVAELVAVRRGGAAGRDG